jgi:hypothetical protein
MSQATLDLAALVNQTLWEMLLEQHPGIAARLREQVEIGQTPEQIEQAVAAYTAAGPLLTNVIACAAEHLWTQREAAGDGAANDGAATGGTAPGEAPTHV